MSTKLLLFARIGFGTGVTRVRLVSGGAFELHSCVRTACRVNSQIIRQVHRDVQRAGRRVVGNAFCVES
jgi:hypothetical protein